MPKFSANLGFLWADRSLADSIISAKKAGFDAVECHFPYDEPISEVVSSLESTGLTMLGLNTIRGPLNAGMAALSDAIEDARRAIDQALSYGWQIGAKNIHVMAGQSSGKKAEKVYLDNLLYASDKADRLGLVVLIEPLNPFDMPGYFLRDTVHAQHILDRLGRPNVKLMFDCYHVGRTEDDIQARFIDCRPLIGHIQIAAVPDRGPPDHGDVDYKKLFSFFDQQGWNYPLGAEYQYKGSTESTLQWLINAR